MVVAEPASVTVRHHGAYGRVLYAARQFAAAAAVVCEELLLSTKPDLYPEPDMDPDAEALLWACIRNLEETSQPSEIHLMVWKTACEQTFAFLKAAPSTRQAVLRVMHTAIDPGSPKAAVCEEQADLISRMLAAMLVPAVQQELGSLLSKATILKVLLAFELNAHEMGSYVSGSHVYNQGGALFRLGSKIPHTCGIPNTEFCPQGSKGYHVALQDVPAGGLFTTCYMQREKLLSTNMRRRHLFGCRGFVCACERCCSPVDDMTYLPCPCCAPPGDSRTPDGLLPHHIASGAARPAGLLLFNPNLRTPGSSSSGSSSGERSGLAGVCGEEVSLRDSVNSTSSSASTSSTFAEVGAAAAEPGGTGSSSDPAAQLLPWTCSSCGAALPDTDEALFTSSSSSSGGGGGDSSSVRSMVQQLLQGLPVRPSIIGGAYLGSVSSYDVTRVEEAVWEAVRCAQLKLSGHQAADVPAVGVDTSSRLMQLVAQTVGPDHGAMLNALLLHTDVMVGLLQQCTDSQVGPEALRAFFGGDAPHLADLALAWTRIWSWLEAHPRLDASRPLQLGIDPVSCTSVLLTATQHALRLGLLAPLNDEQQQQQQQQSPPLRQALQQPLLQALQLAAELLDRAEPEMGVYSKWPLRNPHTGLPVPHSTHRAYCEARAVLAKLS